MDYIHLSLAVVLALVVLADFYYTQQWRKMGGREGNTLLSAPGTQIFATLACLGIAYVVWWAQVPWFLAIGMIGWKSYGAFTNIRSINRKKKRLGL